MLRDVALILPLGFFYYLELYHPVRVNSHLKCLMHRPLLQNSHRPASWAILIHSASTRGQTFSNMECGHYIHYISPAHWFIASSHTKKRKKKKKKISHQRKKKFGKAKKYRAYWKTKLILWTRNKHSISNWYFCKQKTIFTKKISLYMVKFRFSCRLLNKLAKYNGQIS